MHLGYADPFDEDSSPENFDFAEPLEEDAATDPFEENPSPQNFGLVKPLEEEDVLGLGDF